MPDKTAAPIPTPSQVVQNEAAKQAVMLVFGLVTAVIVMRMQRKMMQQTMQAQRDPDAVRTQRMKEAKRIEKMWDKAAEWTLKVPRWFWQQSDKARAAYEADRA